ncbi:MAG: RNA polymerase sigma factor [Bacteroidales bacterium]|nr:RNA polymerase sigma factor [Bacteroidales bacterium]
MLDNIIKGCQAGDSRAQRELYVLFKDKMFGICLRYAGNRDDAQDIVQDGFVKIYEKITQFRFEGSFEGWMRRVMVNTALERYRTHCQVIHIGDSVKEIDTPDSAEILGDISARELLKFVQELSPKYRLVFNLYAIEGYSHKEISEQLDITEGTSKSNLSRARAILQEKVHRYFNQKAVVK